MLFLKFVDSFIKLLFCICLISNYFNLLIISYCCIIKPILFLLAPLSVTFVWGILFFTRNMIR